MRRFAGAVDVDPVWLVQDLLLVLWAGQRSA